MYRLGSLRWKSCIFAQTVYIEEQERQHRNRLVCLVPPGREMQASMAVSKSRSETDHFRAAVTCLAVNKLRWACFCFCLLFSVRSSANRLLVVLNQVSWALVSKLARYDQPLTAPGHLSRFSPFAVSPLAGPPSGREVRTLRAQRYLPPGRQAGSYWWFQSSSSDDLAFGHVTLGSLELAEFISYDFFTISISCKIIELFCIDTM